MEYEILLTAIFHIGLCNKFRDQSSVKGLGSRQWIEVQKVRAGQTLTNKISICADRRYLYFFPDRKSTKCWTNSYGLERNRVQKDARVRHDWALKKKIPHENCLTCCHRVFSPHNLILEEFQSCHWQKCRLETPKPPNKNPSQNEFL